MHDVYACAYSSSIWGCGLFGACGAKRVVGLVCRALGGRSPVEIFRDHEAELVRGAVGRAIGDLHGLPLAWAFVPLPRSPGVGGVRRFARARDRAGFLRGDIDSPHFLEDRSARRSPGRRPRRGDMRSRIDPENGWQRAESEWLPRPNARRLKVNVSSHGHRRTFFRCVSFRV